MQSHVPNTGSVSWPSYWLVSAVSCKVTPRMCLLHPIKIINFTKLSQNFIVILSEHGFWKVLFGFTYFRVLGKACKGIDWYFSVLEKHLSWLVTQTIFYVTIMEKAYCQMFIVIDFSFVISLNLIQEACCNFMVLV